MSTAHSGSGRPPSPATRHLTAGIETADSWATDGHKWLNVPYDSGFVFCAHPEAHAAAMSFTAAYLTGHGQGGLRSPSDYVPEALAARGVRHVGRAGAARPERDGGSHRADAAHWPAASPNSSTRSTASRSPTTSCSTRCSSASGPTIDTDQVVERVQSSGECWMGATTWHGQRLMRISVSSWRTTEADVDRSVAAIAAAMSRC